MPPASIRLIALRVPQAMLQQRSTAHNAIIAVIARSKFRPAWKSAGFVKKGTRTRQRHALFAGPGFSTMDRSRLLTRKHARRVLPGFIRKGKREPAASATQLMAGELPKAMNPIQTKSLV